MTPEDLYRNTVERYRHDPHVQRIMADHDQSLERARRAAHDFAFKWAQSEHRVGSAPVFLLQSLMGKALVITGGELLADALKLERSPGDEVLQLTQDYLEKLAILGAKVRMEKGAEGGS